MFLWESRTFVRWQATDDNYVGSEKLFPFWRFFCICKSLQLTDWLTDGARHNFDATSAPACNVGGHSGNMLLRRSHIQLLRSESATLEGSLIKSKTSQLGGIVGSLIYFRCSEVSSEFRQPILLTDLICPGLQFHILLLFRMRLPLMVLRRPL